ncbi:MAG: acylglycerol kinase family protein, partial [Oscillospiraceae bacterium]|nr:acylglycerol kinase family protein [Oscillospiraceae bacterium]
MENKKRNVLLIVNPCAGRTKSRAGTFDIVNKFSTNDYEFSIHTTTCQGDATNIVRKNYDDKQLVVCCGGDGT